MRQTKIPYPPSTDNSNITIENRSEGAGSADEVTEAASPVDSQTKPLDEDPAQTPANPDPNDIPSPNPSKEPEAGPVPTPGDDDKVTIPEEKLENEESEDSELDYFTSLNKLLEDAEQEEDELEISEEDDHSDNVQGNPSYDVNAIDSFEALKVAIEAGEASLTLTADITFTDQLTITKDLTINGAGHFLTAGAPLASMFFTTGHSLALKNLTMDGGGQSRHIKAFDANLTLTDVTLTKGSSASDQDNSEGGSIWLTGKGSQPQLTLENVTLDANQTVKNSTNPLTQGHGGAIYTYYANVSLNSCTITNNHTAKGAEGGAIFFEGGSGNTLSLTGNNNFLGNHCFETNIPGNQGGAIFFGQDRVQNNGQPTCTISGGNYTTGKPFNTGGILRSWKGVVTISGADFVIPSDAGDAYGISGGSICAEGTNLTIDKCTFTNTGSGKVTYAGGLIDIVGAGSTSNITNCTFTGRGQANGLSTATYGGAICYETGIGGNHTIEGCIFKNFSSDNTGGAIAIGTKKGEGGSGNVTIKGTTIENTQTLFWGGQVGGAIYVGPGNVLTLDATTIKNGKSDLGGLIYNLGSTTIQGGSQLSGGFVYSKVGAGIYNDGYLKLDDMTLAGNSKGDWSTGDNHPDKDKHPEYPGLNVYAAKDVIITPNAQLDAGDVRVLDGQSAILLTGNLNKQINVSISETLSTKPVDKQEVPETASRKLGYVVAKGLEGYTPSLTDAQFLHYLTKNPNAPNQLAAESGDHLSPGKWDFVLDPVNKQVVLGQRAKMTYHGNGSDDAQVTFAGQTAPNPTRTQLYYFYGSLDKPYIVEGDGILQLKQETLPEKNYPQRQKYNFRGWYQEASTNNLYDFTKTDSPFGRKADENFATPEVDVYAGWEALKAKTLKKVWGDGVKDADKVAVTLTLNGSYEDPYTPLDVLADGTTKEAAPSPAAAFLAQANGQVVDVFSAELSSAPWISDSFLAAKQVYRYDKENNLQTIDVQYNLVESPVPEGMTVTYNADFESGFQATNDKSYKVTYRVDGTSPISFTPDVPETKVYASKSTVNVEANLTTDSKEHDGKQGTWTFSGWRIQSPSGLALQNGQFTMPKEDVVLVGTWAFKPSSKPDPKPEPEPEPQPAPQPSTSQTIPELVIPYNGPTQEVKIAGNTVIIRQTQPSVSVPVPQVQSLPRTGQSNSLGWGLGLSLVGLALAMVRKELS
ncbi:MAG: SHIRT domain-containing protein [Eubacteriales bacterium]|nr:SHIRT domain-containing protein [Clostridiales bacterium]MDY5836661.1 SHIRT domain-containing protein [Eubacteriales bacterium]